MHSATPGCQGPPEGVFELIDVAGIKDESRQWANNSFLKINIFEDTLRGFNCGSSRVDCHIQQEIQADTGTMLQLLKNLQDSAYAYAEDMGERPYDANGMPYPAWGKQQGVISQVFGCQGEQT